MKRLYVIAKVYIEIFSSPSRGYDLYEHIKRVTFSDEREQDLHSNRCKGCGGFFSTERIQRFSAYGKDQSSLP